MAGSRWDPCSEQAGTASQTDEGEIMRLIPNNPVDFMADLTGTDAEVIGGLIGKSGKYPGLEGPDFIRVTPEEVRRFAQDNGLVRITSLTPDQEDKLQGWLARWKSACLATDPADRQAAEAAVIEAYAILGRSRPIIDWVDSPHIAQLAGGLLCDMLNIERRDWICLGFSAFAAWSSCLCRLPGGGRTGNSCLCLNGPCICLSMPKDGLTTKRVLRSKCATAGRSMLSKAGSCHSGWP